MGTVNFRKLDIDGIKVFYREAGPKDATTILLLHGFPTAGHMFRDLIPQLADRFLRRDRLQGGPLLPAEHVESPSRHGLRRRRHRVLRTRRESVCGL